MLNDHYEVDDDYGDGSDDTDGADNDNDNHDNHVKEQISPLYSSSFL